jgi:hypothetical protein
MKSLTEMKRWATLRCERCGHRFRWSRDARHSFGNRDGKVYHRPCLEAIMWQSKADERLAILDVVTDLAGISNRLITGVIENRAESEDQRITDSNRSWRVFRDLEKKRTADVEIESRRE